MQRSLKSAMVVSDYQIQSYEWVTVLTEASQLSGPVTIDADLVGPPFHDVGSLANVFDSVMIPIFLLNFILDRATNQVRWHWTK